MVRPVQKNDYTVRGDFLVAAFRDAWLRALKDELVTNNNVASAPAELMQALLVSLDEIEGRDAAELGRTAFRKWCTETEATLDRAAAGPGKQLH